MLNILKYIHLFGFGFSFINRWW